MTEETGNREDRWTDRETEKDRESRLLTIRTPPHSEMLYRVASNTLQHFRVQDFGKHLEVNCCVLVLSEKRQKLDHKLLPNPMNDTAITVSNFAPFRR